MIEDKLSHDERLRLECVNQAVVSSARWAADTSEVLKAAREFESYVRGEQGKIVPDVLRQ